MDATPTSEGLTMLNPAQMMGWMAAGTAMSAMHASVGLWVWCWWL